MPISDLTGYTWECFSVIGKEAATLTETFDYSINFVSHNSSFVEFKSTVIAGPFGNTYRLYYDDVQVAETTDSFGTLDFTDTDYGTITITGGTDATNATLIAWLEANGTLTAPAPSATSHTKIGNLPIIKKMFGTLEVIKEVVNGITVYEANISIPDNAILDSNSNYIVDCNSDYILTTETQAVSNGYSGNIETYYVGRDYYGGGSAS